MAQLTVLMLGILPALVIVAGLSDLTTMKIPNWISGLLILSFFPVALLLGLPLSNVAIHVGVGVVALLVGMALFATRVIGGGDAKLIAASALWLGLAGSGSFLLWTGVVGGVFCLMLMFARLHVRPFLAVVPGWIDRLLAPKGDIPYGVAIAIGALMAFPSSALLTLA